jgi:hypothetical protein
MAIKFILSDYVDGAIAQAIYDKLEDNTFAGRIPACKGSDSLCINFARV